MAAKLFIVGMPGSGKSEVARSINMLASKRFWLDTPDHWCTKRFNDYHILDKMSKDEIEGKLFERLEPRGFNVLDIVTCDIALQKLELAIKDHISYAKKEEIILIEFARNDYWRAFGQFNRTFLQDAYFIYLDADLAVCKQRIRERIIKPMYPEDDYPVSDYIFEKYYHSDDRGAFSAILQDVYGVNTERVLMLNNNGSLETALREIEPFVDSIIKFTASHYDESEDSLESQDASRPVNQQEIALVRHALEEDDLLIKARN